MAIFASVILKLIMKHFFSTIIALSFCALVSCMAQDIVKVGIIGLDTSHSIAFTKMLNGTEDNYYVRKYEVTAAYPYGTTEIESAAKRIPEYTEEIRSYGVRITASIEELLSLVDCVFLETNDGRLHLEQAAQVLKAGKKLYIDKPVGATLGEAIAIYELAELYGRPVFSSSALRFSQNTKDLRGGKYGAVLGADCYSPHHPEPTHPDFGYYGIHGVESLFAVMGTGCEKVSRAHTGSSDVVTGVWDDGRIGTFRAICDGPNIYGGTAITKEKGAVPVGGYEGYRVLLDAILEFFETDVPPVSSEETLEIFTFMKASNMSLERDSRAVSMEEAYKAGRKEADRLLKAYR